MRENYFRVASTWLVGLMAASFWTGRVSADTHYVSLTGGHQTPFTNGWASASTNIATAVTAAEDGDTVLVSNDVYYLGTTLTISKPITVISLGNDPAQTILDGQHAVRVATLSGGATLSGFTLTNGYSGTAVAGGVYVLDATVTNCWILGNETISSSASGGGAGFNLDNANGLIVDCRIVGNVNNRSGSNTYGGGGRINAGTVRRCLIANNSVPNVYVYPGAGIFIAGGLVDNCVIVSNTASSQSGGVQMNGGVLQNSLVSHNSPLGIHSQGYYPIRNCLIAFNSSDGLYEYNGCQVESCTFVSNGGRGIYCYRAGDNLANIISFSNTLSDIESRAGIPNSITNSCYGTKSGTLTSTNSIVGDPRFVDFAGGDFRLRYESPCVDAGMTQDWMAVASDLTGQPRVLNLTPDMGAYEKVPVPYSVNLGATEIDADSAVLNGTLIFTGTSPASVWAYWGASNGGTNKSAWATNTPLGEQPLGALTNLATDLTSDPVYYFTFYASNAFGGFWPYQGAKFYTVGAPVVTNIGTPATVSGLRMAFQGEVLAGHPVPAVWLCWGASDGGADASAWAYRTEVGPVTNWSFAATFEVLPGRPLYYRILASNEYGLGWTPTMPFALSGVHYVNKDNPTPLSPFTNWTDAATTIQDAIDVTASGQVVVVTNGYYDAGGRTNYPAGSFLTNRVVITNFVTVAAFSANRDDTRIVGAPDIRGGSPSNGATAVRCVYISSGQLVGFTITNGYTLTVANSYPNSGAGGVYGDGGTVSNCLIIANRAHYRAGGAYLGTFRNCEIANNTAVVGAMVNSVLYGCFVHHNTVDYTLNTCTLYDGCIVSNNAGGYGIVSGGTATDSVIVNNTGIGSDGGTLNRCAIIGNTGYAAGGLYRASATSCLIRNNSATDPNTGRAGGGTANSKLYNCTVVSNHVSGTSPYPGVRLYNSTDFVTNCIVYHNGKGGTNNWDVYTYTGGYVGSTTNIAFTCTTATNGLSAPGNITNAPLFVDLASANYRLTASSPGVNAGLNLPWMFPSRDLDNTNCRIVGATADMGAYEYSAGSLNCSFSATPTASVAPTTNAFASIVSDPNPAGLYYRWDFNNDGTVDREGAGLATVTNTYIVPGYYSPVLTVTNGTGGTGSFTNLLYIKAGPVTYCVATNGPEIYPYTNWTLAANSLPAVWPLLTANDTLLVGEGTYVQPAQLANLAVPVTVSGVMGAARTVVTRPLSAASYRLFQLGHAGAVLDGLTIANGFLTGANDGGGVSITAGQLNNCIVSNCYAGRHGGGVFLSNSADARVRNCLIAANTAVSFGGGAAVNSKGVIESCTIAGNTASNAGGGVAATALPGLLVLNSVVYGNTGVVSSNNWHLSGSGSYAFTNCCTAPTNGLAGTGNIDDDPLLKNPAAGNYRLSAGSPCYNAGAFMDWMNTAVDLDGRARVLFNAPDIGAYEYPTRNTGALMMVR